MSFFKLCARIISTADNTIQIAENLSKAGAVASHSAVTLAENFDTEQSAKLEAKRKVIDKDIADGKFDL